MLSEYPRQCDSLYAPAPHSDAVRCRRDLDHDGVHIVESYVWLDEASEQFLRFRYSNPDAQGYVECETCLALVRWRARDGHRQFHVMRGEVEVDKAAER